VNHPNQFNPCPVRYPSFNNVQFKRAEKILRDIMNVDIKQLQPPHFNQTIPDHDFQFIDCPKFRAEIDSKGIEGSTKLEDRYFRSYSQSAQDLSKQCHYRIPDIVLWPKSHNDVEYIVKTANDLNVVLIPYGGGTNVSCSVNCPEGETRTIVSLDTTQMNRLLWLDEKSMLACFETGVAGQNLEEVLNEKGFTLGHEPDSFEFSTLGGW
jgi:alkyldihydroxyacetonephosphate synthase